MKSITYTFICQDGQLECEAMVLAASMRRHLTFPAKLVAIVPLPSRIFGTPSPISLKILRDLDVEVVKARNAYMSPPRVRRQRYTGKEKAPFFTNKWVCLEQPKDCDMVVFLDSDQICWQPITYGKWFDSRIVLRRVGRSAGKFLRNSWKQIFKHAGVALPADRVMHDDDFLGPELVNGGLVGIDLPLRQQFIRTWSQLWKQVKRGPLANKYFCEQTALSLTMHVMTQAGESVAVLARSRKAQSEYYHYGRWCNLLKHPDKQAQKALAGNLQGYQRQARRARTMLFAVLDEHPRIFEFLRGRHANEYTRKFFRDV